MTRHHNILSRWDLVLRTLHGWAGQMSGMVFAHFMLLMSSRGF